MGEIMIGTGPEAGEEKEIFPRVEGDFRKLQDEVRGAARATTRREESSEEDLRKEAGEAVAKGDPQGVAEADLVYYLQRLRHPDEIGRPHHLVSRPIGEGATVALYSTPDIFMLVGRAYEKQAILKQEELEKLKKARKAAGDVEGINKEIESAKEKAGLYQRAAEEARKRLGEQELTVAQKAA